jgi:predicted nucleotide-binding protein
VIESKPLDAVTKPETATKSLVTTSTKHVRKNKAVTVATAVNGLVGALNQATSCLANAQLATPSQDQPSSSTTTQTMSTCKTFGDWALEALSNLFLDELDEDKYISYVWVLEDDKKASTFLLLIKSLSKSICHKWLDGQVIGH